MNAADLSTSARLQRVAAYLADHEWHGTRDIVMAAEVMAVSAAVSELRQAGLVIDCKCIGRGRFIYRLRPEPVQLELAA